MTKADLRKAFLDKRKALIPGELADQSAKIADRFFSSIDLAGVKVLHSFLPIIKFYENDTILILHRIWNEHPEITTVVPRVDSATGELHSLVFTRKTELAKSAWGIPEPVHNDAVDEKEIDLIIVPLLAFDVTGHRVGYGRGFYDRLLAKCRPDCQKVGLSFFDAVARIEDTHPGDITLTACITPTQTYKFT